MYFRTADKWRRKPDGKLEKKTKAFLFKVTFTTNDYICQRPSDKNSGQPTWGKSHHAKVSVISVTPITAMNYVHRSYLITQIHKSLLLGVSVHPTAKAFCKHSLAFGFLLSVGRIHIYNVVRNSHQQQFSYLCITQFSCDKNVMLCYRQYVVAGRTLLLITFRGQVEWDLAKCLSTFRFVGQVLLREVSC